MSYSELRRLEGELGLPVGVTVEILRDVASEVGAQFVKWGDQRHPDGTDLPGDTQRASEARALCEALDAQGHVTWRDILYEEFLEALAERDPDKLRKELIQVAAVATSWVRDLDRRTNETIRKLEGDGDVPT